MKALFASVLLLSCSFLQAQTVRDGFHVLLIVVDDLNDWIGALEGHPQTLTPHIDQFARGAINFRNAHVASPLCNPSRVSFLTGFSPKSTGIYANSPSASLEFEPQDLGSSEPLRNALTIQEYFSRHGYETVARGKMYHDDQSMSETWDNWVAARGNWGQPEINPGFMANGLSEGTLLRQFDWGATDKPKDETRDFKTSTWLANLLSTGHEGPLFIGAGITKPHLPWYLPKEYYDKFPLESIIVPEILADDLNDVGLPNFVDKAYTVLASENKLKEPVQAYLANINYADEALGIMLEGLDQSPLKDSTIVVITADHGWHLGEKLRYRKFTLWEEATRVPLLIRIPGVDPMVIDEPVSLLDLYPTLIDYCRLPKNTNNEGTSLRDVIEGGSRNFTLTTRIPNNHSIRSKRYRFSRDPNGTVELYDHFTDSLEHHNLANESVYQQLVNDLNHSLDSMLLKDKRSIQYATTNHRIPGNIQMERYDSGGELISYHDKDTNNTGDVYRFDGVDIFATDDGGGGFEVLLEDSEWLEYSLASAEQGIYEITFRGRSEQPTSHQLILSADEIVMDTLYISTTGQGWEDILIPAFSLEKQGNFVLNVKYLGTGLRLNHMTFRRFGSPFPLERHTALVPEDSPVNSLVASLPGYNDNGKKLTYLPLFSEQTFALDLSGSIWQIDSLNFESQSQFQLNCLSAYDYFLDTVIVEISVEDINEAPKIQDLLLTLPENQEPNSLVGSLSYHDPDGDSLMFGIAGPEHDSFKFDQLGNLRVTDSLDYETQTSFSATITAFDGELADSARLAVEVTDVNEPPFGLSLDGSSQFVFYLDQSYQPRELELSLKATDPEGDSLHFAVASNSFFEINDNLLTNVSTIELPDLPISINVEAGDGSLSSIWEIQFTNDKILSVEPGNEPTLQYYPNPTSGLLHIEAEQRIQKIILIDNSGRIIHQIPVDTKRHAMNTSTLATGTYWVYVFIDNRAEVRRFIKR